MDAEKVYAAVVTVWKKNVYALATVDGIAQELDESDLETVRRALDRLVDARRIVTHSIQWDFPGSPDPFRPSTPWYVPWSSGC